MYQLTIPENSYAPTAYLVKRISHEYAPEPVRAVKTLLKTNPHLWYLYENTYYSYSIDVLNKIKSECTEEWMRENTIRAVTAYLNGKNIKYTVEESDYRSVYFKYMQNEIFVKIRVSNHPSNDRCATAEIRYDMFSSKINYPKIRERVTRILDNAFARKSSYTLFEKLDMGR